MYGDDITHFPCGTVARMTGAPVRDDDGTRFVEPSFKDLVLLRRADVQRGDEAV